MGPFLIGFDVFGPCWGPGVVPMCADQNSVRFPATNASNRAMATQIKSFFIVFVCIFAGWETISYVLRVPARWGTISYVLRVPGEYVGI